MAIWGKIIGGICGLLLAGPLGLLLGVIIGHFFDRGMHAQRWHFGADQHQAQQAFFNATFLVMGYIAKADGRVSEAEIQAARKAMQRLGLSEAHKQQAMLLFQRGKQADFNLEQTLAELIQACHHNKILLRLFIELQLQAALADSGLNPTKQRILQTICQRLGFAPLNFVFFEQLFGFQQRYQHQHSQGGYQQQHNYRGASSTQLRLEDAYALLGVAATATDVEVKRAYRRMMSQHHPDKLVAKGLPEEMMKIATEKTQNIKAAYDRICDARGLA